MDSNNDHIKKHFSEETGSLPPELNWEHMEAGIYQKMEEIQATPVAGGLFSNKLRISLIFNLFLLILLVPLMCTYRTNQNLKEHTSAILAIGKPTDAGPATAKTNTPATVPADTPDNPLPVERIDQNKTVSSTETKGQLPKTKQNPGTVIPPQTTQFNKVSNYSVTAANPTNQNSLPFVKKELPVSSTEVVVNTAAQTSTNNITAGLKQQALVKLPLTNILVKQKGTTIVPKLFTPILTTPQAIRPVKNNTAHRLTALNGLSIWNMGFSKGNPDRAAYESTLTSYQAQINYLHTTKQNFIWMIGLQYQQLESQFDWKEEIFDHTVTIKDTIIQVQNNAITGQQSTIRGDVEVPVTAEYVVRHYNRSQVYQIPFALGKTWQKKKWQADLLIGGAFSIYAYHNGRTRHQGEMLDYNGNETAFLDAQWKLQSQVSGRLTYSLNPYIGITTGVQWQRSLTDWSKASVSSMHPNIIGMEVGLSYQLK